MDFIDINMGCPIDIVVNKGAGSALLTKPMRMKSVVEASSRAVDIPVTIKVYCYWCIMILSHGSEATAINPNKISHSLVHTKFIHGQISKHF